MLWNNVEQMQIPICMIRGVRTLHDRQYHINKLYKTTKRHITDHYTPNVSDPDESPD